MDQALCTFGCNSVRVEPHEPIKVDDRLQSRTALPSTYADPQTRFGKVRHPAMVGAEWNRYHALNKAFRQGVREIVVRTK